MSNELIRKTDVLDLLNDFYSDFEDYSHLFDDIDFMNPVNAVELPCKIGDKVYEPCKICGNIHEYEVTEFHYCYNMLFIECESRWFDEKDLGVGAFFTREEAEAALEKMKENRNERKKKYKSVGRKTT